jgi:translation initiation factor IF-1
MLPESNDNELKDYVTVEGQVSQVMTGSCYQVFVEINDRSFYINALLSGRLRVRKVRVVQGDKVMVEINVLGLESDTNPTTGRIIQRL